MAQAGPGHRLAVGCPKGKKSGKGKIVLLVIIALIAIFMVSRIKGNSRDAKNSKLDWPTSGLATMLPEPGTDKGKGIGYAAFNEKGYKLSLTYYERKEELTVHLEAPDEMSTITWPTSGPGSLLPAPPSTQGSIVNDSSKLYQVNVGGMDKDAFSAYAAQCKEAGFDVDYSSGDTYYQAKNADGAKLRVDYKGANVVSIRVDVSDASSAESDAASSPASTDSSTTADSSIVTPEFKETMDSYEEFMNKYCDFMVKYTGASAADQASMLADYTDLVQQEADWAQRISAVDESTLSDADDAYYIEVQARVSKRHRPGRHARGLHRPHAAGVRLDAAHVRRRREHAQRRRRRVLLIDAGVQIQQ